MRKPSYVDFLVSKTRQRLVLLFLLLIPIAAFSQKGTFRTLMQVQGTGLSKQFKPYELCCDLGYNKSSYNEKTILRRLPCFENETKTCPSFPIINSNSSILTERDI